MTTVALPRNPALRRPLSPLLAPAPVDLANLTNWQLRVALYASGYELTTNDMQSPVLGLQRLIAATTTAVERLGLDTIRAIADIVEYAHLRFDHTLTARFCPDSVRWDFTECSANFYRKHTGHARLPLHLVDTLADQFHNTPVVAR